MMVIAPFLGGLILRYLNWHWIFFINVVLGCLISPILVHIIRNTVPVKSAGNLKKFDWFGFVFISIFTIAMTLTFNQLTQFGWLSFHSLIGFLIAVVSIIAFYHIEKRQNAPVIDIALFKITNYIPGCTVLALTQAMNLFTIFFAVYIQNALGFSPMMTGILLLPMGALLAIFSNVSGRYADKLGARLPMMFGLGIITLGYLLSAFLIHDMSYFSLLPAMICYGVGASFLSTPLRASIMKKTPKENFGMATSIISSVRQMGGVIVFAIIGYIVAQLEKKAAMIQLMKQIPLMAVAKVKPLLGILSHTAASQKAIQQYSTAHQVMIKQIVLSGYIHAFFYAMLFMGMLLLVSFLIAVTSIKQ